MATAVLHLLTLCLLLKFSDAANFGIDVSTLTSNTSFACLVSNNYTFVAVRIWRSSGVVDTNCPSTVSNAWTAGMKNVDVYFYPCVSCGNVAVQVQNAAEYLTNHSVVYTKFWLDVEGTWSTNTTSNQEFFSQMLTASVNQGLNVGVYTSKYQWTTIMGSSYTGGSAYPLWYPHYDNSSSFSDFVAFGGWTSPIIKQYLGTTSICGASVDFNYATDYPLPSASPSPSHSPSHVPSASVKPPSPSSSPGHDSSAFRSSISVVSLFMFLALLVLC
mmetsp:Transcript_24727/g.34638  ORF Transcript_24727/g.34638 Transcript_24727/m.34638 type:complete len:273 (+) Transcript_24727:28-846(+)